MFVVTDAEGVSRNDTESAWVLTVNGVTTRVPFSHEPRLQHHAAEVVGGEPERRVQRSAGAAVRRRRPGHSRARLRRVASAIERTGHRRHADAAGLCSSKTMRYMPSGTNAPMTRTPPVVEATVAKYRGPGTVTAKGLEPFTTIKGGKPMEPYAGKASGTLYLQRARRLHRPRHDQRLLGQGRRRLPGAAGRRRWSRST